MVSCEGVGNPTLELIASHIGLATFRYNTTAELGAISQPALKMLDEHRVDRHRIGTLGLAVLLGMSAAHVHASPRAVPTKDARDWPHAAQAVAAAGDADQQIRLDRTRADACRASLASPPHTQRRELLWGNEVSPLSLSQDLTLPDT